MSFAVAFDLRHFIDSFTLGSGFGIFAVDWFSSEPLDDREYPPVAQITVVRDS